MKAVLEEYGMIIIVVAIVLIFLLFATPLGNALTDTLEGVINKFLEKAKSGFEISTEGEGTVKPVVTQALSTLSFM